MIATIKYVKEKMNANQEAYRTIGLTNGMTGLIVREEQFFPYLAEGYTYDFTIQQEGRWSVVVGMAEASAPAVDETMQAIATPVAATPAPTAVAPAPVATAPALTVAPLPQVAVQPPTPAPPTAAIAPPPVPMVAAPPTGAHIPTPVTPPPNQEALDHTLREMLRSKKISYLSISSAVQRHLTDLWVSQVLLCADENDYIAKVGITTQALLEAMEEYVHRTTAV